MRHASLVLTGAALALAAGTGCLNAQNHGAEASQALEDHHRIGPMGLFSAKGPINTDPDGVALHGYDVVAYFTEGGPAKGSEAFEVEHGGATFRFASREHRDRFEADPEAYLPAYGGYCSLGVANGYKDGMHPEAFEIIDGRLYFNLTPEIHRFWLDRREALIRRADANWPFLRGSDRFGPGIRPR